MNIRWDSATREFVAEFSDFANDLEAVKAAGFRTNGAPEWKWFAPPPGVKALNRLRANKPASGLSINEDALAIYQPLALQEEKNAEVKKQLLEVKKSQKKEKKQKASEAIGAPFQGGFGPEDLPPMPPFKLAFIPPPPPDLKCFVCGDPVYWYEYPEFEMCMWCAKTSSK